MPPSTATPKKKQPCHALTGVTFLQVPRGRPALRGFLRKETRGTWKESETYYLELSPSHPSTAHYTDTPPASPSNPPASGPNTPAQKRSQAPSQTSALPLKGLGQGTGTSEPDGRYRLSRLPKTLMAWSREGREVILDLVPDLSREGFYKISASYSSPDLPPLAQPTPTAAPPAVHKKTPPATSD